MFELRENRLSSEFPPNDKNTETSDQASNTETRRTDSKSPSYAEQKRRSSTEKNAISEKIRKTSSERTKRYQTILRKMEDPSSDKMFQRSPREAKEAPAAQEPSNPEESLTGKISKPTAKDSHSSSAKRSKEAADENNIVEEYESKVSRNQSCQGDVLTLTEVTETLRKVRVPRQNKPLFQKVVVTRTTRKMGDDMVEEDEDEVIYDIDESEFREIAKKATAQNERDSTLRDLKMSERDRTKRTPSASPARVPKKRQTEVPLRDLAPKAGDSKSAIPARSFTSPYGSSLLKKSPTPAKTVSKFEQKSAILRPEMAAHVPAKLLQQPGRVESKSLAAALGVPAAFVRTVEIVRTVTVRDDDKPWRINSKKAADAGKTVERPVPKQERVGKKPPSDLHGNVMRIVEKYLDTQGCAIHGCKHSHEPQDDEEYEKPSRSRQSATSSVVRPRKVDRDTQPKAASKPSASSKVTQQTADDTLTRKTETVTEKLEESPATPQREDIFGNLATSENFSPQKEKSKSPDPETLKENLESQSETDILKTEKTELQPSFSKEKSQSPERESPRGKLTTTYDLGSPAVVMKARSLFHSPTEEAQKTVTAPGNPQTEQVERKTSLKTSEISVGKASDYRTDRKVSKEAKGHKVGMDQDSVTAEDSVAKGRRNFGSIRNSPERTPKRDSKKTTIEDIDDLGLLENMLNSATGYDERSKIRAQIRSVRKKLAASDNSRDTAGSNAQTERDRTSKFHETARDVNSRDSPPRKFSAGTSKNPDKINEKVQSWRRSPEKDIRKSPEKDIKRDERSPSRKTSEKIASVAHLGRRKSSEKVERPAQIFRPVDDPQEVVQRSPGQEDHVPWRRKSSASQSPSIARDWLNHQESRDQLTTPSEETLELDGNMKASENRSEIGVVTDLQDVADQTVEREFVRESSPKNKPEKLSQQSRTSVNFHKTEDSPIRKQSSGLQPFLHQGTPANKDPAPGTESKTDPGPDRKTSKPSVGQLGRQTSSATVYLQLTNTPIQTKAEPEKTPQTTDDPTPWRRKSIPREPSISPITQPSIPTRSPAMASSVRSLAQKFQSPSKEVTNSPPKQSFTRTGIVLQSSSFKSEPPRESTSGSVQVNSNGTDHSTSDERRASSIQIGSNVTSVTRRTSVERKTSTSFSSSRQQLSREPSPEKMSSAATNLTAKSNEENVSTTRPRSFLEDRTPVKGMQDIIERMRAVPALDSSGRGGSDDEARSLLNKFLGAQILVQCTEPLVRSHTPDLVGTVDSSKEQSNNNKITASFAAAIRRTSGTEVTALDDDRDKPWTHATAATTSTILTSQSEKEQKTTMADPVIVNGVDISTCDDDFKLNELLDTCNDYETRRKIRNRIKAILSDPKPCSTKVKESGSVGEFGTSSNLSHQNSSSSLHSSSSSSSSTSSSATSTSSSSPSPSSSASSLVVQTSSNAFPSSQLNMDPNPCDPEPHALANIECESNEEPSALITPCSSTSAVESVNKADKEGELFDSGTESGEDTTKSNNTDPELNSFMENLRISLDISKAGTKDETPPDKQMTSEASCTPDFFNQVDNVLNKLKSSLNLALERKSAAPTQSELGGNPATATDQQEMLHKFIATGGLTGSRSWQVDSGQGQELISLIDRLQDSLQKLQKQDVSTVAETPTEEKECKTKEEPVPGFRSAREKIQWQEKFQPAPSVMSSKPVWCKPSSESSEHDRKSSVDANKPATPTRVLVEKQGVRGRFFHYPQLQPAPKTPLKERPKSAIILQRPSSLTESVDPIDSVTTGSLKVQVNLKSSSSMVVEVADSKQDSNKRSSDKGPSEEKSSNNEKPATRKDEPSDVNSRRSALFVTSSRDIQAEPRATIEPGPQDTDAVNGGNVNKAEIKTRDLPWKVKLAKKKAERSQTTEIEGAVSIDIRKSLQMAAKRKSREDLVNIDNCKSQDELTTNEINESFTRKGTDTQQSVTNVMYPIFKQKSLGDLYNPKPKPFTQQLSCECKPTFKTYSAVFLESSGKYDGAADEEPRGNKSRNAEESFQDEMRHVQTAFQVQKDVQPSAKSGATDISRDEKSQVKIEPVPNGAGARAAEVLSGNVSQETDVKQDQLTSEVQKVTLSTFISSVPSCQNSTSVETQRKALESKPLSLDDSFVTESVTVCRVPLRRQEAFDVSRPSKTAETKAELGKSITKDDNFSREVTKCSLKDPSEFLFTPSESIQIAIHKAAIKKQLSEEEKRRGEARESKGAIIVKQGQPLEFEVRLTGSNNQPSMDMCPAIQADTSETITRAPVKENINEEPLQLTPSPKESEKEKGNSSSRFAKKAQNKELMRRANTVDISATFGLKTSMASQADNQGALHSGTSQSFMKSAPKFTPIKFTPKTENDKKFLAFLDRNTSTPSANQYRPAFQKSPQSAVVPMWTNKFSNLRSSFENKGQSATETPRSRRPSQDLTQPIANITSGNLKLQVSSGQMIVSSNNNKSSPEVQRSNAATVKESIPLQTVVQPKPRYLVNAEEIESPSSENAGKPIHVVFGASEGRLTFKDVQVSKNPSSQLKESHHVAKTGKVEESNYVAPVKSNNAATVSANVQSSCSSVTNNSEKSDNHIARQLKSRLACLQRSGSSFMTQSSDSDTKEDDDLKDVKDGEFGDDEASSSDDSSDEEPPKSSQLKSAPQQNTKSAVNRMSSTANCVPATVKSEPAHAPKPETFVNIIKPQVEKSESKVFTPLQKLNEKAEPCERPAKTFTQAIIAPSEPEITKSYYFPVDSSRASTAAQKFQEGIKKSYSTNFVKSIPYGVNNVFPPRNNQQQSQETFEANKTSLTKSFSTANFKIVNKSPVDHTETFRQSQHTQKIPNTSNHPAPAAHTLSGPTQNSSSVIKADFSRTYVEPPGPALVGLMASNVKPKATENGSDTSRPTAIRNPFRQSLDEEKLRNNYLEAASRPRPQSLVLSPAKEGNLVGKPDSTSPRLRSVGTKQYEAALSPDSAEKKQREILKYFDSLPPTPVTYAHEAASIKEKVVLPTACNVSVTQTSERYLKVEQGSLPSATIPSAAIPSIKPEVKLPMADFDDLISDIDDVFEKLVANNDTLKRTKPSEMGMSKTAKISNLKETNQSTESYFSSRRQAWEQSSSTKVHLNTALQLSCQNEIAKNMGNMGRTAMTRTEVITRSSFNSTSTRQNQPISAFAKFQQLDKNVKPAQSLAMPVVRARLSATAIKERIIQFCQRATADYKNVQIENFSSSWSNGLAFCALIHHFYPDAFDYEQLKPENRAYNFELAFKTAEDRAGIAPLLDVEDMVMMARPDWKCVFTYVQSIYRRLKDD